LRSAVSGGRTPLNMFDPQAIDGALRHARDPLLQRVEEAGLNAAQPREQRLVDGWLLRFSPGKARRARSVQAIAAGTLPLGDKLARCRRLYERFGLPLLVRVTPFSQPASLDDGLADAGFIGYDETRVMTCSLPGDAVDELAAADHDLALREVGVAEFAQAVGRLRGSPPAQSEAHLRRLLDGPLLDSTVRLIGFDGGNVPRVAGQVVVEDDLAGLYDIVTDPADRGRGHAGAISRQLLRAAVAIGAGTAYLQVDAGNAPARRVYSKLGFVDRYAYWYRRPADVVDDIQQEGRST
jgi:ribosomal protein S18 acetylase RimI-like enzyme